MAQIDPGFQAALEVCGLADSQQLRVALVLEGLTSFQRMGSLNAKDIDGMAKNMTARPLSQGGYRIGTVHVKHLKALNFWVHDLQRQQLPIPAAGFTAADLSDSLARMEIESTTEEAPVKDPPKFTGDNWVDWCPAMINKLASLRGSNGIPLDYIVRNPEFTATDFAEGERGRRIYAAPLTGPHFNADNLRVSQELVSQLASTPGQIWMDHNPNDGRKQWLALYGHFEGPGYRSTRYNIGKNMLDNQHYRNESVYPFSTYVAALSRAFQYCKDAEVPLYPRQKVNTLVEGIKVEALKPAIEVVMSQHPEDFEAAAAYLSSRVSQLFPVAQQRRSMSGSKRRRDTVSSVGFSRGRGRGRSNTRGGGHRGGRGTRGGRGRSSGRGNGGRGEAVTFNGVDITNPHRRYSNQEMNRLGREGQRVMFERRRTIPNADDPRTIAAAMQRISALESQLGGQSQAAITDETAQGEHPPAATSGRGAGTGFGRGAYRGRGGRF